ncbi:MAG: response regulator [Phototrophicaceae bacterium]
MTTVLYIEDNALNMRLVRKYLKSAKLDMLEATDGLSGVDLAKSALPSAVLIDINLPNINGLEVAKRLKADSTTSHIPLIALTANAMYGDRQRCLDAGCDDYLAKPISRKELLDLLREHLPEAFSTSV